MLRGSNVYVCELADISVKELIRVKTQQYL